MTQTNEEHKAYQKEYQSKPKNNNTIPRLSYVVIIILQKV